MGSINAFNEWVNQATYAGDPFATAIAIVQFFAVSLVNLFTGGPIL
ncbi:hypothetical protein ACMHYT_01570 [Rhodococcus qingshengii]|jgi:hypothetical protein|uniref:Uncharacterized protein n=2 Tax=Rhodococcus erythropolis group TaxID=2840174 RepID=A0A1F2Q5S5_RHOER|nr:MULTISPECIES: hypothetical protein [Rhodococcus]ERB50279.1 hypothetical protein N806_03610 [Rhodococcus sp. P27]MBF7732990.1 hypothetical protein [Rhodococcus erythropolis]MBH5142581.1 hypothetical protein [Rhodococcus erythropolis]MBO8145077.1 hypothetical protein [Rhodococcus erythropolis]MBP2525334.1 hypothetical protein [Rhodococcus sp. PvP104]